MKHMENLKNSKIVFNKFTNARLYCARISNIDNI